jgi:bacillithiol system protein YtxJ
MGLFKAKNKNNFNWLVLNDEKSYGDAIDTSFTEPILIFKHSTRCSISTLALNRIESKSEGKSIKCCYYLDLLSFRDISNKIAEDFSVFHQSPQVLVIKNGKCIYNTSHSNINWANIKI